MSSPIDWLSVKALSFDIYGTLVDWESGIYNAARSSTIGDYLPSRTETLNGIDEHDVKVQAQNPTMLQSEVIAEGFRRFVQDLGLVAEGKVTQADVDQAAKDYGAKIGEYPAFEDTVAAIQSLGKRFKLIPLSNVDRSSFSQTLAGPLKGCHFDAIYTAQDIGSYKPDLRNFHYLLEHVEVDFGVRKEELVHVAQSLFHDHRPANWGEGAWERWGGGVWVSVEGGEFGGVGEGCGGGVCEGWLRGCILDRYRHTMLLCVTAAVCHCCCSRHQCRCD
jgi:2-haloalkanoic acid dehalogenase type II